MAANLSVTGPLRVAVPSPHTPSSRGSPPPRQPTPQSQSQGQGLIRVATPPPANPRPQIHRPFSPAWYDKDDESRNAIGTDNHLVLEKSYRCSDIANERFEVLWRREIWWSGQRSGIPGSAHSTRYREESVVSRKLLVCAVSQIRWYSEGTFHNFTRIDEATEIIQR